MINTQSDLINKKEIRRKLRGLMFPVDVVVYTPEELAKWEKVPLSFACTVMSEGKVLYG